MQENELLLNEVISASFVLTEHNHEAFYYWIDRFLFKAHAKAAAYLQVHPPQQALSAMRLGRLRLDIKKHVSQELKEIDKIVKQLIG